MRWFLAFAFALSAALVASPAFGEAAPVSTAGVSAASAKVTSTTASVGAASAPPSTLFQRDSVLANWALKKFDGDRDILLSNSETAAAAAEFRKIADGDGDGRVTPAEYRAAREFILARY